MIAFLVITTVINIALGYALAVYLSSERAAPSAPPLDAFDVAATQAAQISLTAPERAVAASLADAMPGAAAQSVLAPRAVVAAEPAASTPTSGEPETAPESHSRTAGMEQDLLAGIEEFRNQLAQLKAQNFDDGTPAVMETASAG